MSKAEWDVNAVSCKHALILAKSTKDSLLDFTSPNMNSNGSRNFEYSIFLHGMAKLGPVIRTVYKRRTSDTLSDNEWYNEWEQMTTTYN